MSHMHWGRKVVIGLGVVFLLLGGCCLIIGWRGSREFHQWQTAEPVRFSLDLRAPGKYVAPYKQTCGSAHGTALELQTGITNAEEALAVLRGVAVIRDTGGQEVIREEFDGKDLGWASRIGNLQVPAVRLGRFGCGNYNLELTITEGATGLTTTNHTLVGRYILCGLERMPAAIMSIAGWLLLFLASLCAVITFRYLRRRKQAS